MNRLLELLVFIFENLQALFNIEIYSIFRSKRKNNLDSLLTKVFTESYSEWLKVSKLNSKDAIFIFSVGGGNFKKKVSINLIKSINFAKSVKAKVFGVVGRDGGYTKKKGDNVILIPVIDKNLVTPHTEAYQAVVWHCLVSHPLLQKNRTKW